MIRFIVIADVGDDPAILRLYGVEFMVFIDVIAWSRRDWCHPSPRLPVIEGFANSDTPLFCKEFDTGIKKPPVAQHDGPMGAAYDGGDP